VLVGDTACRAAVPSATATSTQRAPQVLFVAIALLLRRYCAADCVAQRL
jgi:hypothetical protein